MYFKVFIICLQMTKLTNAVQRKIQYVRPSASASLAGLGCALDKFDTERARGARFNPQTGACESLLGTWFCNPTEETDFNYFNLKILEDVFEPSDDTTLNLTSVVSGYKFVIFFTSGADIFGYYPSAQAQIMISLQVAGVNKFRMAMRTCCGTANFNDGGSISNPITFSNTTYTLEGQVNSTHIQVFIDGVHIYDFTQTTDPSNYDILAFKGRRGANILQFIQYYPY